MNYSNWQIHIENHIARLIFNRPKALNSLSADTLLELKAICEGELSSPEVWVIVLEGAGGNFSAGVDISLIKPLMGVEREVFETELKKHQACIDAFEALPQPKIAKIEGYCIGGGLIMAACCDFRLASEKAVFSLPEVKMGIAVIMGTKRITRLAGIAATKEMILLADTFKASKALSYGLLTDMLAPEKLDMRVNALAKRFIKLPPRTIQAAKKIIDAGEYLNIKDSQALEVELQSELLGSSDWYEAVKSHFEKRDPQYQGK